MSQYCTHALCHAGEMTFCLAGKSFRMTAGDCIIFVHNELITDIQTTDNFRATVVYISYPFLYKNIPRNDYDVNGKLTLLQNPVMPLNEAGQRTFIEDVSLIGKRLECDTHHFYSEWIGCYTKAFILDLYDFHAQLYGYSSISKQSADIMNRFVELLRSGLYQTHREVSFYASQLCITPKYLTEVSKKASGFHANFWIDRFTITEITRLLSDKTLTLKEISERMNFASVSYFCRYVMRILKVTPSAYRNNLTMKTKNNPTMNIRISQEENSELPVICNLIEAAFADMQESDHQEHHLVDKLHKSDTYIPELSLVAKADQEEIVGYILLTKVEIVSESEVHTSLAVAPLAVLPEYQNRGIGGMLLKEAHKRAAAHGYGTAVLLGHKDYYPRFGYRKAADYGITFPFDVPSEYCQVIELIPDALKSIKGIVRYPSAFFE